MSHDYSFNYTFIGDYAARTLTDRQKPVIVFLHGFLGNSQDFLAVIDLISPEFCCLVLDLPGHGQTEVKQDINYHLPNLAQALIALLEQLNIRQCFLVGYSLGGRIALYLTIYFPQYFLGVILESASPGLKTQPERDRRIQQDLQLIKQLESQDFADFLQQWYSQPLFSSFAQHPNFQQALIRRLNNNPVKLSKSLRYLGLGMQPSLWSQLKSLQIPLLLVVGELDSKFVAINREIANLCPQANLNIVKNSGHNVHFEQLWEFSKLLERFLRIVLDK
ncbi:MAG: 2-succinyl-6-hydroxy-2,4-cyclohexadiene-1-carboxylate synthase [Waterburya sp.]